MHGLEFGESDLCPEPDWADWGHWLRPEPEAEAEAEPEGGWIEREQYAKALAEREAETC